MKDLLLVFAAVWMGSNLIANIVKNAELPAKLIGIFSVTAAIYLLIHK